MACVAVGLEGIPALTLLTLCATFSDIVPFTDYTIHEYTCLLLKILSVRTYYYLHCRFLCSLQTYSS